MKLYPIIDITDPGKDLDDEQKFLLLAGLTKAGVVDIKAVITNLEPPLLRARLAKGTFNILGLNDIPVGVGTDCYKGGQTFADETDVPYLADASSVINGYELLEKTLHEAEDHSIIVMLKSGLTDAAQLLQKDPDLFVRKVVNVTIMGGVKVLDPHTPLLVDGKLVPDDAANNTFDPAAAEYLYRTLQELNVPTTIIMRPACYAAPFSIRLYEEFAATGNPVGLSLRDRQKTSIQHLWQAALSFKGSPLRGTLPMNRNREWFVKVFCDGKDPGIGFDDEIWPFVLTYNQYDPMAVLAAIPELRDHFYDCLEVIVDGITHRIIGLSSEMTGVKDKEELIMFVSKMELGALKTSMYTGTIIEESLENKSFLKEVRILNTRVEEVIEKHKTPWIKQWTLHTVEIPEDQAEHMAERISKSLDREHAWYADFKNKTHHYIIFRDKVFYLDRKEKKQHDEAKRYGILLGIPEYQVDFSPDINSFYDRQ